MRHPEILVRSNVPFPAPPNLEQDTFTNEGEILQDEVNFLVEDLGIRGSIRYLEIQPDLTADYPTVFPAGAALPLTISIYLHDLTMTGLEKVRCALIYRGKTYWGNSNYDETEMSRSEFAKQRFWYWVDPDTNEVSQPIFPREAAKNIAYLIEV